MVSKQKTTFKKKDGRQLKLDFFTKKTGANDGNSAASREKSQEKTKDSSIPDNQKSIFKTAASNVFNKNTKKNTSTTRGLTLVTAEKWKSTHLVLFDPDQWLLINADKKGNVQSLQCKVCKNYAKRVESMRNFSSEWAFNGSTTLQLSNTKTHASGEPHKEAMRLHYKDSGKDTEEVAANVRDDETQSTIQS